MQQVPCLQLKVQVRLKQCQTLVALVVPRRPSILYARLPGLVDGEGKIK